MYVYFSSALQGYSNIQEWVDTPESLTKKYLDLFLQGKNKLNTSTLSKCPAIKDYCDNTFVITSPYDYEISWDGDTVRSSMYDQEAFNQFVLIRDTSIGFIGFQVPYLYLFAEKSLVMEFIPAHFHDNEFVRSMLVIPGKYDIGQHLRKIECACKFREPCSIKIKRGDPLYYVKFNTSEKIEFKRFFVSEQLFNLSQSIVKVGNKVSNYKTLDFYYNILTQNNLRKTYLRLIRENLL